MIYILLTITVLCILLQGYMFYYFYKENKNLKKENERISDIISNIGISLTELKEFDKLTTQNEAKYDITLINLVDVPFLQNELDPGYPKEWAGELPYKIPELFIGSEIKVKYVYTIDDIKDKWIKISRK